MKAKNVICAYTNKIRYSKENEAIIALGREARHSGFLLKHYLCHRCRDWHLARIKKKREKPDESIPN